MSVQYTVQKGTYNVQSDTYTVHTPYAALNNRSLQTSQKSPNCIGYFSTAIFAVIRFSGGD